MDEKLKNKILDVCIVVGIILLFIYYALKDFGYINTPLIVKAFPYLVGLPVILMSVYRSAVFTNHLSTLPEKVEDNGRRIGSLGHRVGNVENRLEHVEKDVKRMDKNIISIDLRLKHIEAAAL